MQSLLSWLRSHVDHLGIRLALVLAVALLPLMIVSIVRSQSVVNEAVARSQAALVGETLRAVQDEVLIIERAKAVAQSLSRNIVNLLETPELCSDVMRDQLRDTAFSFAGFYDTTGFVPCSSAPEPFGFGVNDNLREMLADPRPTVQVNQDAPASGTSVIYASFPVYSQTGTLLGFTAVSVPHQRLRDFEDTQTGANFLTLNAVGTVLTGPDTLESAEALMPRLHHSEDITQKPSSFRAMGLDGIERIYALAPVVEGELFALSSWPLDKGIQGNFYFKTPALFPALMWLASLAVAWFAASLFVTRPVIKLRHAMRNFAETRDLASPKLFETAPRELRDVSDTFIGMSDTILHDEAELEDAVHQKEVLLREVHHRVKNNLQLIASIMSMQMRQSNSQEVRQVMQDLHDRVNSLATIHRNLYQTSGQANISMDEHLADIVRQVIRMGASRTSAIKVETDFAPIKLNPDQAVPLSLFVTEAITNALKYIGSTNGNPEILKLSLETLPEDRALVTVSNSLPGKAQVPDSEMSTGFGSELMEAFSDQLSGKLQTSVEADHYTVRLDFEVEPLTAKS